MDIISNTIKAKFYKVFHIEQEDSPLSISTQYALGEGINRGVDDYERIKYRFTDEYFKEIGNPLVYYDGRPF